MKITRAQDHAISVEIVERIRAGQLEVVAPLAFELGAFWALEDLIPQLPQSLVDVLAERYRQDEKWGEQNHPDGTGAEIRPLEEVYRTEWPSAKAEWLSQAFTDSTDLAAHLGDITWRHIFLEEVFEAIAESDPVKLRTELIQAAAVATQWVEAIDRREAK